MAKDRVAELKGAIKDAEANGWTYIGNNTVRRMVEHETPQFAKDAGWWTPTTYRSLEFLSFVLNGPSRVPHVIYGTCRTAWTGRRDQKITWKRTLELLAQPVHLSEVHEH